MPSRDLSDRLERLITASNELVSDLPQEALLQRVTDLARELLHARYAAIGVLAPDGQTIESFITSGLANEERARLGAPPTGRGVLGLVIREGRPVRLDDLTRHPQAVGFPAGHPPMRSFLGVPIVGRHAVIGNLYVTEKLDGSSFSDEDEHLAVLLAGKAAIAVEDARLYADSARLVGDVQTLLRSRERFFAMVNHELRNALAAVLGWSEMLVRRKDPATVPRAAFEVLEAAQSAAALINDLLDLARLDEDRLRPVIQPVDCGPVLRKAVGVATPAAEAKGVTIDLRHPEGPVACETDGQRVEQILVNLLTNAIKHTAPDSTVTLNARIGDDRLTVEVLDEGRGIPPENLDRVFDVYFTRPSADGSGLGLGLPLSRRLARVLGGDLLAGNREEGGAIFTLELPRRGPEQ